MVSLGHLSMSQGLRGRAVAARIVRRCGPPIGGSNRDGVLPSRSGATLRGTAVSSATFLWCPNRRQNPVIMGKSTAGCAPDQDWCVDSDARKYLGMIVSDYDVYCARERD